MTDEPFSKVGPWMEKNGVTHPVVIMPRGELENVIGVTSFPSSAIFLGDEMKWKGRPGESNAPLKKIRKEARDDGIYPKKLTKVIKSYNKGELIKAMLDLQKLQPKLTDTDAAYAQRLTASLGNQCAKAFKESAKTIEDGYWFKGMQMAQPYLGKNSPFVAAEETAAKLEALKQNELYSKEVSGGELFMKAKKLSQAMEYTDSVKVCKSILKKCTGTQIAEHARRSAQDLINAGKPGYKYTCSACRKGKTACGKHAESIKL